MSTDTLASVFYSKLKHLDDRGRWATEEEARLLYAFVKDYSIGTVFEIGTANGWTASWMALAGARVYTYDIVDRAKVYEHIAFPVPALVSSIVFTKLGSPECVEDMKLRPLLSGPVLFFIDGDHSTSGVMRDFEAIKPLFKDNDVIVFHDTKKSCSGVYKMWKRMQRTYPGQCQGYSTRNGMGVLIWQS